MQNLTNMSTIHLNHLRTIHDCRLIAVISSRLGDVFISIDFAITGYAKLTSNDYYIINDLIFTRIMSG